MPTFVDSPHDHLVSLSGALLCYLLLIQDDQSVVKGIKMKSNINNIIVDTNTCQIHSGNGGMKFYRGIRLTMVVFDNFLSFLSYFILPIAQIFREGCPSYQFLWR